MQSGRRPAENRLACEPADHLLLVYLNFHSITETTIVMLSLPFALVVGSRRGAPSSVGGDAVGFARQLPPDGLVMIYLNQALAERRSAEESYRDVRRSLRRHYE